MLGDETVRVWFEEYMMAVKVMIRRRVDDKHIGKIKELLDALEVWASKQTGYFYGERIEDPDRPGSYACVGTWRSEKAFRQWLHSSPTQQLERAMASSYGVQSDNVVYL